MTKPLLAILFILFLFAGENSQAQTSATNDTLVVQELLDNLKQLLDSNLNAALISSRETEKKAAQINYQNGIWEAQIYEGKALFRLGHPDSAKILFTNILKETQKQNSRLEEIKVHNAFAVVLQDEYNFHQAVDHLIQAEKLTKESDPFALKFEILNGLAITHRKMKDYTSALKYFDILERSYFDQMDTLQRYILFQNKGNVYAMMKEYDKTEEFFKKAYNEIVKIDSPANQALITYNLGALYYRQKRYEDAGKYIDKALEEYKKIGNKSYLEQGNRVLGAICYDRKKYSQAVEYYALALEIARQIKSPRAVMANYNNFYLTYWDWGYYSKSIDKMDKALTYYQKYNNMVDSLYKVDTSAKILELETKYETEKKNNQIGILEKETQHQEDQIRVQKAQRNYLFLIIILVSGILGIFIYSFYYNKRINKLLKVQRKRILNQKSQIEEKNSQLQKSINTQNKLFSIIAHDLRSPLASIFNISSLIGFYIEDKNYEALRPTVKMMDQKTDQILDLTDNLLNWARSQTDGLRPLFAPMKLREIVNECLELYRPIAKDKNITISFGEQEDLMIWADRNMVKTICRNLVNNAVKYTHRDGHIKVWYEIRDRFARISVRDNGVGIDAAMLESLFEVGQEKITRGTAGEKSTGLGLSVCKEFADVMNGQIWVESEKGVGSQFNFEILLYNPEIHVKKQVQSSREILPEPFPN